MFELPAQIVTGPIIVPGIAGIVIIVTAKLAALDDPQALFAITLIVPLVEPAVVEMLFVVDVPDQPLGNVQV